MKLPERTDLPLFAYGVFQPGQLAFHRVKAFVAEARSTSVVGELWLRDGLPILDCAGSGRVSGWLLTLTPGAGNDAYRAVVDLEPGRQYRWGETEAESRPANVLCGRAPKKGSVPADEPWDGRRDPLFTAALDVVEETLAANPVFEWDLKPLFRLQMAYLLLWSAIERYASLRYHLGDAASSKVSKLADEPEFVAALHDTVTTSREVFRADRPDQDPQAFGPGA